ncbi:hypothetical protein J437_LFUL016810 [Ladona fulva]|uniref:Pseudouridylate synthase RPUSD4, mitochondrial n=1 Tax=Ladona fulva TaxID=123851 RepID=A0A8K0JZ63_LADFU|nr:hypothetical protein J437_LFUL016810 [Ladona fulva]
MRLVRGCASSHKMFRCSFICAKNSVVSFYKIDATVIFARLLSSLEPKINTSGEEKPYTNLCPWKSKRELTEYLLRNTIYNENGLIALNKPYGLGIQPPSKLRDTRITTAIPNSENYTIAEVLPLLGNNYGVDRLMIVKSPEKYSSGITLLATSNEVFEKVVKCKRRDLASVRLTSKYLAVVVGQPKVSLKNETVNYLLVKSPDGKSKQPIVQDFTAKQIGSEKERKVRVAYNTISHGSSTCLVEIKPSTTRWHFLRVYLSHLLSPVLGDNLYSSRVTSFMGVTVAANPFNNFRRPQILGQEILEVLNVSPEEEHIIPCHIHLQEVVLTSFHKNKTDLTILAPPPSYFQWTCEKLNLKIKN